MGKQSNIGAIAGGESGIFKNSKIKREKMKWKRDGKSLNGCMLGHLCQAVRSKGSLSCYWFEWPQRSTTQNSLATSARPHWGSTLLASFNSALVKPVRRTKDKVRRVYWDSDSLSEKPAVEILDTLKQKTLYCMQLVAAVWRNSPQRY